MPNEFVNEFNRVKKITCQRNGHYWGMLNQFNMLQFSQVSSSYAASNACSLYKIARNGPKGLARMLQAQTLGTKIAGCKIHAIQQDMLESFSQDRLDMCSGYRVGGRGIPERDRGREVHPNYFYI